MAGYKGLAGYAARGIAALGLLAGCTMPGNVTPTPTEQSRLEQTVEASATAQPTTAPTDTPYFTDTPTPTPTPTPKCKHRYNVQCNTTLTFASYALCSDA